VVIALWEASDRVCGKRLKPLIPVLLPALERHGAVVLTPERRERVLAISPTIIDRLLGKGRARSAGCPRRRTGFTSAVRRSVPIRTFADWQDPPPGYLEGDLVAHCGESAEGSFVQTLVLTDIATGWTECLPLVLREGALVIDALDRARTLFPFPLQGVDLDNDTVFMNEAVVGWCRAAGLEVTRSRAYRKNDQAWVEQKNGAVVRRLVGYARFEGLAATAELARLYAAARWRVNAFQASLKRKEKIREGGHAPASATTRRSHRSRGCWRIRPSRRARRRRCARPRPSSTRWCWARSEPCRRRSASGSTAAPAPARSLARHRKQRRSPPAWRWPARWARCDRRTTARCAGASRGRTAGGRSMGCARRSEAGCWTTRRCWRPRSWCGYRSAIRTGSRRRRSGPCSGR
jgi:hypothetical protein